MTRDLGRLAGTCRQGRAWALTVRNLAELGALALSG